MSILQDHFTIDTDSADDDIDGAQWDARNLIGFSIHVDHGEITGTLTLQARNHESLPWTAVSGVSITAPAGSATQSLTNVAGAYARFYRVVYTSTGGDAALRVCVHGKSR